MSVLARMRKPSPYNYYTNAIKLRKSMRFLLLRDLGIKDKVREVHEFAKDMSEDDRVEFILLASKYGVEQFKTEAQDAETGKVGKRGNNIPQRFSDTV